MPIQFRFHPEKAVEAAAILMKLHGNPDFSQVKKIIDKERKKGSLFDT